MQKIEDVNKYYDTEMTPSQQRLFDIMIKPDSFLLDDEALAAQAAVSDLDVAEAMSNVVFMEAVNVAADLRLSQQAFRVKQAQTLNALSARGAKDREQYLHRYDPSDLDKKDDRVIIVSDMDD